jgi:hypothetical protein
MISSRIRYFTACAVHPASFMWCAIRLSGAAPEHLTLRKVGMYGKMPCLPKGQLDIAV